MLFSFQKNGRKKGREANKETTIARDPLRYGLWKGRCWRLTSGHGVVQGFTHWERMFSSVYCMSFFKSYRICEDIVIDLELTSYETYKGLTWYQTLKISFDLNLIIITTATVNEILENIGRGCCFLFYKKHLETFLHFFLTRMPRIL